MQNAELMKTLRSVNIRFFETLLKFDCICFFVFLCEAHYNANRRFRHFALCICEVLFSPNSEFRIPN